MSIQTAEALLATYLETWKALLSQWSLDGSLSGAAQEALLLDGEPEALTDLITQWSQGDFRALPEIVLLSSADISGAMGAYAASTDTIYLNEEWLATASQEQIVAVLTEELGHFLDDQLNSVDTPGDEGEYFARLLSGETLPVSEAELLRSESDIGSINLLGSQVSSEFASLSTPPTWIKQYGTIDYDTSQGVAVAENGNIWTVTTGRYLMDGQTKTNDSDNYATIFAPDGSILRSIYVGSITSQWMAGVSASGSQVYVGGQTISSLDGQTNSWGKTSFVSAYDVSGNKLWTRLLPGYTGARSITSDSSGVYTAGFTYGGLNGVPGLGGADAFLAKHDAAGNLLWAAVIGGNGDNANGGINQVSANGSYAAVAGYTNQSIDGQPQTSGGFVSFFTASGTKLWTRMSTDGIGPVYVAPDNSVYISGGKAGTTDFYISKFDSIGNLLWTNTFGTSGADSSIQLSIDKEGDLFVLAATNGSYQGFVNAGGYDNAFLSINANTGVLIKADQWGSSADEGAAQFSVTADGTLYLSGSIQTDLPGNTFAGGTFDPYLIKFNTPNVNTGSAVVTISGATGPGAPAVDDNLTTTITADPDGNGTFSYAWQTSSNGTTWSTVGTNSSYTVVAADEGKQLQLVVSYTDVKGFSETVTTAAGTVLNGNEAPTDLIFTTSGIAENSAAGTVIGTLLATDPDAGSTFTYALVTGDGTNDADNSLVEIVGNEVRVKSGAVIDFETNPTLDLNIQVTDNGTPALSYTKAVTTAVLDVNENPVIRGNSLYTIVDGPSWTEAEAISVSLGGHLTTIESESENSFLVTSFANISSSSVDGLALYLGYTDQVIERTWRWISGSSSSYQNWADGEPNSGGDPVNGTGEDFAVIYPNATKYGIVGVWNDIDEVQSLVSQGIAETPFIRRGDSAYVIVQGPTWEEAQANAVKLGGNLVTINDAAENEWIIITLGIGKWIGINDKEEEGVFEWSSGDPVTFTDWAQGEPNNTDGRDGTTQDYGYIQDQNQIGKWDDAQNGAHITLGIAEIRLSPNNAPTGVPAISGTFKVGETVAIDTSQMQDADNFTGYTPSYSYSWEVSSDNGATWTPLSSADATDNNSTYLLTAAEAVKKVRGVVSYIDGYGTNEVLPTTTSAEIEAASVDYGLNNTLIVTGAGAGTIDGIPFADTFDFDLAAGIDAFTLSISAGTTSQMTVAGGDGNDSLYGNEADNILVLTGLNEGTLDGVAFSGFENVYLGAGNDKVYIKPGGQLTGVLDGGTGSNGEPEPPTIILLPPDGSPNDPPSDQPPSQPPTDPVPLPDPPSSGPLPPVDGGYNSIYLNDNANTLTLTGAGSGVVDSTSFTRFYAIEMRGGDDTATIAIGGSLLGTLDGGLGNDGLTLNAEANSLTFDHLVIGTAAGTKIASFEAFDLAAGDDDVSLDFSASSTAFTDPALRRSASIDGGLGTDALDLNLSSAELDHLTSTGQLSALRSYLAAPDGQSITLNLLATDLTLSGFEQGSGAPDLPLITLSVDPASGSENGNTNLTYTFSRTGPTTSALTVNYLVTGTATLGSDYSGIDSAGTTKTVTFAENSATTVITVDPTDDTEIEADETVVLTLESSTGYTLGTPASATGTITNSNQAPSTLDLLASGIAENSPAPALVGTLEAADPDTGDTLTFSLALGDGTNDADNDLVEIVGNEVRVKAGAVIDYEANPALELYIQVTDDGSPILGLTKAFTVNVINVQEGGSIAPITSSLDLVFEEGVTLAAGAVTDPDIITSLITYTWFLDSTEVQSGVSSTYVVGPRGAGTYSVVALYTDGTGESVSATSATQVVAQKNNGNGSAAAITSSTGVFQEGVTLTAGAVSGDIDGDADDPVYAYQWYKDRTVINGATVETYQVPSGGAGTYEVQITYTDAQDFRVAVESPEREVTAPAFAVGLRATDDPSILVSGLSGTGATSLIERLTTTQVNVNPNKGKPIFETRTTYETLFQFTSIDGISFDGGDSANTISATGVAADASRPAFNGQIILDGRLGADNLTGGSYRNWLIGGGIFSTSQATATSAVDTLTGTAGKLDIFDLRTSDFQADAYSAVNTGSARILNYSRGEDKLVLSGEQSNYRIAAVTSKSGKGKTAVTTTTGYEIFSGTELVATISPASGAGFTGTDDLSILYGQKGSPSQTLFAGEQLFFG